MNFWMMLFGVLTVVSALGVVLARSPLNSALWLVVTFFLVAAHYGILGADFLSAVQVMVYAGAIMVLVIFVIMLLGSEVHTKEQIPFSTWALGAITSLSVFGVLGYSLSAGLPPVAQPNPAPVGSASVLGDVLFSKFLFPFEITSFLLLAAIVGAVVLGADKKRGLKAGRGLKATRARVEADLKRAA